MYKRKLSGVKVGLTRVALKYNESTPTKNRAVRAPRITAGNILRRREGNEVSFWPWGFRILRRALSAIGRAKAAKVILVKTPTTQTAAKKPNMVTGDVTECFLCISWSIIKAKATSNASIEFVKGLAWKVNMTCDVPSKTRARVRRCGTKRATEKSVGPVSSSVGEENECSDQARTRAGGTKLSEQRIEPMATGCLENSFKTMPYLFS